MKSKKRIFLIGLPGTGKSFLANLLADETGIETFDLDELIEQNEKRKISYIFETDGEERFREIEADMLKTIAEKNSFILATGGGTPCFHDGMSKMNSMGITVYLTEDKEVLVNRLSSASHRPLIKENAANRIDELLMTRRQFYEQADLVVAHRDPKKLLFEIDQLEIES